jgi:uncharacterized iron-regulated protein
LALGLLLAACAKPLEVPIMPKGLACPAPGAWLVLADGGRPTQPDFLAGLAGRSVVLLGETHDRAEHHRWQLQVLAGLYARNANLVLGFEAFPRSSQGALNRWAEGELDEKAFLEEARWKEIWGFDPDLYLPLLHFARMNRVPLVALNVERGLARRVAAEGWDAVPEAEREGVGRGKPADAAYLEILAEVYREHPAYQAEESEAFDFEDPGFRSFVEAQLVWDRAMAEALAAARRRPEGPLVVGIVGQGHLMYGHGVPRQLTDLGVADAAVLLPYEAGADCEPPPVDLAEAVFGVDYETPAGPPPPRLGVRIEAADGGLRVSEVMDGSVAAEAGLQQDDVIEQAAGQPVAQPGELIEIISRQAPGTWLPLAVRRDGETIEIVARFPPVP